MGQVRRGGVVFRGALFRGERVRLQLRER